MRDTEYQALDGLALADLLARREVRPEDLMACAIKLAQERAPAMNALCYERYEESLDLARDWHPRGVFGAVPFLLKDSGLAHTRFPSSLGSRLLNDTRDPRNATLHSFARRWRSSSSGNDGENRRRPVAQFVPHDIF